ncbi:thiosulfate ABC transporter substrate-binding protein CysP [Azospirillum halopraeferens]|uniref:thiosulfate ABC transporter substrate-binding protein CysP n=1 Tax=Azospirillum halopraeferens TaxID=34010 RepID=UPI00048B599E|nr:thiosulfate ABC transporter substrate-binding protein CysP [Azospirillum halopraeferens]
MRKTLRSAAVAVMLAVTGAAPAAANDADTLLNVSYDIARELYAALNPAFQARVKAQTGRDVTVNQSHAGSSRQARAILEGLAADVVTFNQVTDVQILADRGGLVAANWQERLPNAASPYYSLPAFLVRAGNPKNIRNWDDLAREGVQPVFPNPKTSGNARYTYLAATAYGLEAFGGDADKAADLVRRIFANVPVFDTGGRGATTTFAERGIGDVLVTFEAEVNNIRDQFGADKYEVVVPPVSLLAEFPVSVVDRVVDRRGTRALAESYLNFLYEEEAQEILARFYNRIHHPAVIERHRDRFPEVRLFTVEQVFGGWAAVEKDHFAEGGRLDTVFVAR